MKLTVETNDDGDLVATLRGYRDQVLDADRTADHFFEAILAALTGPGPVDEPEPEHDPAPSTSPSPSTPTRPADPEQVQREALRRLDAGEAAATICAELGITAGQLRRWDDDPSIDAGHDELAAVMLQ